MPYQGAQGRFGPIASTVKKVFFCLLYLVQFLPWLSSCKEGSTTHSTNSPPSICAAGECCLALLAFGMAKMLLVQHPSPFSHVSHLSSKINKTVLLPLFLWQPSKHPHPKQIPHFTCSCKPFPHSSPRLTSKHSASFKTSQLWKSHSLAVFADSDVFAHLGSHFHCTPSTMLNLQVKFLKKTVCAPELCT